jgi:transposase InsO family protein
MEIELQLHPSYGSRNLAKALRISRDKARRVMRKFGIKPYRRRKINKYRKPKLKRIFPNLLLSNIPSYEGHIWVTDFTELIQHSKKVYASTIIDLFSRKVVGLHIGVRKGAALTIQTLANAILHKPPPAILHSDNGREYEAENYVGMLNQFGINISRSRPACPWENGYQESFYGKFKLDLGDPNRFKTLGELVAEIYRVIWHYNNTRIHSALNMSPVMFAEQALKKTTLEVVETLS